MLQEYLSCFSLNEVITRSNGFKIQLGKSVIIMGQHLQSLVSDAKLLNLLSSIKRKIVQIFEGGEQLPFQHSIFMEPSIIWPNQKTI